MRKKLKKIWKFLNFEIGVTHKEEASTFHIKKLAAYPKELMRYETRKKVHFWQKSDHFSAPGPFSDLWFWNTVSLYKYYVLCEFQPNRWCHPKTWELVHSTGCVHPLLNTIYSQLHIVSYKTNFRYRRIRHSRIFYCTKHRNSTGTKEKNCYIYYANIRYIAGHAELTVTL